MKDRAGNWIQGEKDIADFIRNGYVELFSSSHNQSTLAKWDLPYWQTYLKEEDSDTLTRSVLNEDIATGLWSLKAFKAPGLDGLHADFFQHFWLFVGESVRNEVGQIFTSSRMPVYLNRTVVTLISKCRNPESFSHYQPISLCNTVYKIISKIIVARIRPFLPNLVSPLQTAFVPGRKGIDNAIIV